jgi:hypothetical protein
MVRSPGVWQPVKEVDTPPVVVGLRIVTDEIEQPSEERTPSTEALRSEEEGIIVLLVKMDGSSKVQFTVDGPILGKLLGRFRL